MNRPRLMLAAALGGCLTLALAASSGQDSAGKVILLNVSQGQLPGDTGLDDKTFPEIVANVSELGGKGLKIAFAAGDSFGSKTGTNKNWKRFALLRFDAVNTSKADVKLELVVVHARSTSYQTRVAMPIKLKPGKNEVKVGIDEMTNVNGSAPNLADVVKWYISAVDK